MDNIKISVIVPIYKVEKYLDSCIQSILNQKVDNMEIILVDDGSPDRCGEICDNYASASQSVKVVHKENGGLSDARNAGIKVARGEYIAVIDSDDYIEANMLKDMLELLEENAADIAVCGIKNVNEKGDVNIEQYKKAVLSPSEALCKMLYEKEFWVAAWNKIYKRAVFEGELYPVGRLYEDFYETPRLFLKAKKIVISNNAYYCYRTRDDSIMGKSNQTLSADIIYNTVDNVLFFENMKSKLTNTEYEKIIAGIMNHLYSCMRQVWLDRSFAKYKTLKIVYSAQMKKISKEIRRNHYMKKIEKILLISSIFSFFPARILTKCRLLFSVR